VNYASPDRRAVKLPTIPTNYPDPAQVASRGAVVEAHIIPYRLVGSLMELFPEPPRIIGHEVMDATL
jgi:hypothetical protein